MEINNRNHRNPTVRAWQSLKLLLQSFTDRLNQFDDMIRRQGRDIGIDEVYNEIQNIRKELDSIQNSLNLYNGTISQGNKGVNPPDLQGESKSYKNKIRLSESQLHNLIKESAKRVLNEVSSNFEKMAVANSKARLKRRPKPYSRDELNAARMTLEKFLKKYEIEDGNAESWPCEILSSRIMEYYASYAVLYGGFSAGDVKTLESYGYSPEDFVEDGVDESIHRNIKKVIKEDIGNNVITEPSEIYNVLRKGLFNKAIITNGNGSTYTVVYMPDGIPMYYDESRKDEPISGGWHTFYYPSYEDICRGMIKQVEILEEDKPKPSIKKRKNRMGW